MDNATIAACPKPFLSQSDYSPTGGYLEGRFCSDECCLPCPLQDLVYSDDFPHHVRIAGWISVVSLVCSMFLLLTFLVLPPHKSHRHYLSIGLTVCNVVLHLAFIIPLGASPDMCYNDITPRDMYSSVSCTFSGAFILWGGMGSVAWTLSRSLWTHLRVCWDVSHSRLFLILSHVMGWGIPTLFLGICLKFTGVSYRLTNLCFPNNPHAFTTFFGWVISFAGLAFALQVATSGYCLWVYILNLWKTNTPSNSRATGVSSARSPIIPNGHKPWNVPRQQAWARVRKVLILQWRSISLVFLVIALVATLSGVFVSLNASLARDKAKGFHANGIAAWGSCLVITQNKNKCLPLAKHLKINETPLAAALIVTSFVGVFSFLLLFRLSALKGWYELVRNGPERRVSEDFLMVSPRRITLAKTLASEARDDDKGNKTPLESPISAYFPTKRGSLPDQHRQSIVSSIDSSFLHHRDSVATTSRGSQFIENPAEFEEKRVQDLERGGNSAESLVVGQQQQQEHAPMQEKKRDNGGVTFAS